MGLFAALALITTMSCNQKAVVKTDTPSDYFELGSGGGFTGAYEQYKVDESGEVMLYDFDGQKYIPYTQLSTSATEKVWTELKALNIKQKKLDQPGNFNYYIRVSEKDTMSSVKWNDAYAYVPKELKSFFSRTELLLKNTK